MRFGRLLALLALLMLTVQGVASAQQAPPVLNAPPAMAGGKTYRLFADVVTSGAGRPGVQGALCVTQTVFFPGDLIVFRSVIADGPTGTPLTAADVARLGLTAVVSLSDGSKVPLRLGTHPPPPNAPLHSTFWSGSLSTKGDHRTKREIRPPSSRLDKLKDRRSSPSRRKLPSPPSCSSPCWQLR